MEAKRRAYNGSNVIINVINLPPKQLDVIFRPVSSAIDFVNTVGGIISLWLNTALFTSFSIRLEKMIKKVRPPIKVTLNLKNNRIRPMEQIVNVTIMALCSLGCALQCIDIAKIYVENNLYTWVSGVEPEKIYFPKITLCLDRILLPEKVQQVHPEVFHSVAPEKWPKHFTIDQMFDLTIDLEDIYISNDSFSESCFVSPAMKVTPILDEYSFEKQLTDKYVCFNTFSAKNYKGSKPLEPHSFAELSTFFFFILYLKKLSLNYTTELKLFMHWSDSFPMDDSFPNFVSIQNKGDRLTPNLVYFSLNEIRQVLVPDSYASKCFVYNRINRDSQEDAIQACICNFMVGKYKMWPSHIPVARDKANGLQFANESHRNQMKKASDFCHSKYPLQDCDSHHIFLRLVDYGFHSKYTQLLLYPPPDSYTEIRQDLRFTISDLVVFIGSCINSWLGYAIIDLMDIFKVTRTFRTKG